jgi:pancreatic triacylglycerol lipase
MVDSFKQLSRSLNSESQFTAFATPINGNETLSPHFDAVRDVRLLLLTRNNRENSYQLRFNDLSSLQQSPFNAQKPLRFLIHGWMEDDTLLTVEVARDLLDFYDFNVIFVDWPGSINYAETRRRVPLVANVVASYLDFLHANSLAEFRRTSIIGTSIGAHIAGHVGKNVRRGRVNTIVGLDPGGLLYSINNPEERLDAGDAEYVEAIHTNGGGFADLGIGVPIAHADFFPNGGSSQPGCITNLCSHSRAVTYYSKWFLT